MRTITATEFKKHFGKYSELAQREEILVTSFGKVIYKLVPACMDKMDVLKSLIGILPENASFGVDPDERD